MCTQPSEPSELWVDALERFVHGLCMPTRTISIEVDVYKKLVAAKRGPDDSFSKVIRRTTFEACAPTGAELLGRLDVLFAGLPDDGRTLDDALAGLPGDPPVTESSWDEIADESGGERR